MKVLAVTKYPPIQGGVSASAYWVCNSMVELGHHVTVVTNSEEVENGFRINLNSHDFAKTTFENLKVRQSIFCPQSSYIPWANPFFSKLLGSCLQSIDEDRPDFIYGSYFEPYGLVATVVGKMTNIPVFVRHAGSDLGRLSLHPQLQTSYRWMIENSTLISPFVQELNKVFPELSLSSVNMPRYRLPHAFSNGVEDFDITAELQSAGEWFNLALTNEELRNFTNSQISRLPNSDSITIGTYGKIADAKGSFDLLKACDAMARDGIKFNLVNIGAGHRDDLERYYRFVLENSALADRTWILPPIAPWRIPSFIASCDIVAFLERDFSVGFHTPMIPREVLAMGTCLITSGEVAAKRDYVGSWVHKKNVFIVDDPRNCEALTSALREVVENDDLRKCIGAQGRYLSKFWERSLPSCTESVERFIANVGDLRELR